MRLEAFVSFHIGCVVISRLMEGILVFSSREITFYSKKLLVHTHYALVRELRPLPLSGVWDVIWRLNLLFYRVFRSSCFFFLLMWRVAINDRQFSQVVISFFFLPSFLSLLRKVHALSFFFSSLYVFYYLFSSLAII